MNYREPLPEDCPPETAEEITAPRLVYRLVRHTTPTDADFRSQRAEKPYLELRNITECQARGLSVFANRTDAERRSKSGQLLGTMVCEVTLSQGQDASQKREAARIIPGGLWPTSPSRQTAVW